MPSTRPCQLPLGIKLDDEATFDNFHITSPNEQAVRYLSTPVAQQQTVVLWGAPGSGRTHLAQAVCHRAEQCGLLSMYIPCGESNAISPAILQGLDSLDVVCVDDLHQVEGKGDWEQALFRLYNASLDSRLLLLIISDRPPQQFTGMLPDLRSRLQSGMVFQLQEPDEAGKRDLLKLRAINRGLTLDDAVVSYILQRSDRSVSALLQVLATLDRLSLQEQRRITIPLVKQAMQW